MPLWRSEHLTFREIKLINSMGKQEVIGVLGAGTMGSGIAQVAAQNGHKVILVDLNETILNKSKEQLERLLLKLVDKGKISQDELNRTLASISYSVDMHAFAPCSLIIEAIKEDLEIKTHVFKQIEQISSKTCILASNTSSLSITSLAAGLMNPSQMIGIHFFNPAPLMRLVEVIPAIQTNTAVTESVVNLLRSWNKISVTCKDVPGFIVNRVARPFYGEALRIYEEGIADFATIDWAMTELGGFKMGPFTLMDYIGNDVNYAVTESVHRAYYFEPRYKPSLTQKRYVEAGFLGVKSGRGYYDYRDGAVKDEPKCNLELGEQIKDRILAMLINEAYDALLFQVASAEDLDLAILNGVNYPKGLLAWAEEIGYKKVLETMEELQHIYGEDRYRTSPMLRRMVAG